MYFKRFENSDMLNFLKAKSKLNERNRDGYCVYCHSYHETIREDDDHDDNDEYYSDYNLERINDDKYSSYVYRIGVLYMWDANKCDFAEIHIAFQTDKNSKMIYIGKLDFEDGENMDLLTTVQRIAFSMVECMI